MDDLAKQLTAAKEKGRQQEEMQRKISQRESKIKDLEEDINRYKKSKESIEKQLKSEADKFTKLRETLNKDLLKAKKDREDKEREVKELQQEA